MADTDEARIRALRYRLLTWGLYHTKPYPWRFATDPYRVLVAEMMLQRTQAPQVVPVYRDFTQRYPTLECAALGSAMEQMEMLRPLGLSWRSASMLRALETLWSEYGSVPVDMRLLQEVRGIGPYVAGATVCYVTDTPVALVDTNTLRVVGRIRGLDLTDGSRRRAATAAAVGEACDPIRPRDFYYAAIDFAHEICTAKNPACSVCPMLTTPCSYGVRSLTHDADMGPVAQEFGPARRAGLEGRR